MFLSALPFPHVLLALFEQVHTQTIWQVLLVGAKVAVTIVERVDTIALALGFFVLTHIVGTVCTLLHPDAIANSVGPRAFIEISIVVPANTIATSIPSRIFTCRDYRYQLSW
jgi:hypothetical protein